MTIKRLKLKISGMTCEHCASSIEKSLVQAGVIEANISYLAKGGTVSIDLRKTTLDDVLAAVQSRGHYRVVDVLELNSGESSSARHLIIIGGGSAAFTAALQAHELGARVIAPEGGELIMQIAMGLKFEATVADLREMLHPYLTASEGVKLAAITFTKNLEQLSCCAT
ncbi:pyridine nucleotide-disulfide oxidoreductase dimerization region [Caldithrix abyssi DSM 13497]|uniref:Pyridine nucleotide-disulfide oxidoreductase dimerization region n=1 Tax=Caldithrix abyssi DSM 13497 TaxID=880073 RepID=H1XRW8_CALAY|nr:cation transporter [Caldithrix abyssi]APF18455.1 Pyridine nucleotide-disulfide oxidoreductase, dimerization domain [Caldithrix abyssi DSM 13497]EHO42461.1 pyridine nucleotide-disulfide oxidoreductase dimerization region [Caldithrix abyssi DSM 13497]